MNADPVLALAPLLAAAAAGRRDRTAALARAARDAGLPAALVREALRTLVPYCGVPRALDAFAAAAPALGPADGAADPLASRERGAAFFSRVYGDDAGRVRSNLAALDPEVASWVESFAYGAVLSRPGLDASLRERIGVVLLAAQGQRQQVSGHVRGALRCGATAAEVAAFADAAAEFLPADELAHVRDVLARVAR